MKIDRILMLACDRPDYLKDSLARALSLGVEIVAVLDKPSDLSRIKDYKRCEAIIKTAGVTLVKNKENLGCSKSMYLLLEQRHPGINLILEDDIVLKDDFDVSNLELKSPFFMQLSSQFLAWGWVADGTALDIFKSFREGNNDVIDKKKINTSEWKAQELFRQIEAFQPWDEKILKCANFCNIKIKSGFDLTNNIGEKSSRKASKSEGKMKYAIFKNGTLFQVGENG